MHFTLLLQDWGFSMTSNLGSSKLKLGKVFMSAFPYICLSLKSSLSRSCWYSGPVSTGPPDACRLVLYSLILSTKSFCTGSSSLLNATAVTPMFLLRWTETADRMRQENLKSLWRIMVSRTGNVSEAVCDRTALGETEAKQEEEVEGLTY